MSNKLPLRQIADDVCAAPQLGPEQMADVAAAGFRSIVNNRPDFEYGPDQPAHAAIEAAARAAGLEYRFLPVDPAVQTAQDAAAMARLLAELPRPLLMFCRTGNRSIRLFALAQGG